MPAPFQITAAERAYREALRMAEIRLMQSEECRIGYIGDAFKNDAADLLRAAGRADLADRLDEDIWGGDTPSVLLASGAQ